MNEKTKIILLTVVIALVACLMASSAKSTTQLFSTITFIMIVHFYLSNYYKTLAETQQTISKKNKKQLGIGQKQDQEIYKIPNIIETMPKPIQRASFEPKEFPLSEKSRVNRKHTQDPQLELVKQQLGRHQPFQDIANNYKFLRTDNPLKKMWHHDLIDEERRIWWEDDQNDPIIMSYQGNKNVYKY